MLFIMLSIDLVFNKLMNELVIMKFRLFNWFNSLLIEVSFEIINKTFDLKMSLKIFFKLL